MYKDYEIKSDQNFWKIKLYLLRYYTWTINAFLYLLIDAYYSKYIDIKIFTKKKGINFIFSDIVIST